MKRVFVCAVIIISVALFFLWQTYLFSQGSPKKKTVYFTVEFSRMEIGNQEYTGSPSGIRYNSDGLITYEFDGPISMKSLSDTTFYSQAKKAMITYWKNDGWHTKNILGKLKKIKKKSPIIEGADK